MREYVGELAGREVKLAANFKASMKLAKQVGDPLMIAREANLEALMTSKGLQYNPKWNFTVENVPEILHIGLETNGSSLKLSDVQEWVFEAGFAASRDVALEYLALIIGPAPEETVEKTKDAEGN